MCFSGWSKNRVRLTLLDGLFPVRYSSTKVVINGLPESIRGCPAKLTSYRLDMQHSNEERVLSIAACQKLQKIDRQRYILDLSQEEIALLDHIDRSTTTVVMGHEGTFHATFGVKEHGICLLMLEAHFATFAGFNGSNSSNRNHVCVIAVGPTPSEDPYVRTA